MGQALHFVNGVVKQIGAAVLNFDTMDRAAAGTLAIGQANASQLDLAVHANTTTINIGTGAGLTTFALATALAAGGNLNIATGAGAAANVHIGAADTHVHVNGNLIVQGTEDVIGNTTFAEDVTLGDAANDAILIKGTLTFDGVTPGRVGGDIPFASNNASVRSITVDSSAAGTALRLAAGATTTAAAPGQDLVLQPGVPGAGGAAGKIKYGSSSGAIGTADGFEIRPDTGGIAGLRYNDLTNAWQIQADGGSWTNISTSTSAAVEAGTVVHQHLFWDGSKWDHEDNLVLESGSVAIYPVSVGVGGGGSLSILGGATTAAGQNGGNLELDAGSPGAGGNAGDLNLGTDVTNTMAVRIGSTVGLNNPIVVGQDSTELYTNVQFGGAGAPCAIDMAPAYGTRITSSVQFRADAVTAKTIDVETTTAGKGTDLKILAGAGDASNAGGSLFLDAGPHGPGGGGHGFVGVGTNDTRTQFVGVGYSATSGQAAIVAKNNTTVPELVLGAGGLWFDDAGGGGAHKLLIGNNADTKFAIYANRTIVTRAPGFRYNSGNDKWEIQTDGADWAAIGAAVPGSGTDVTVPVTVDGGAVGDIVYIGAGDTMTSARANALGTAPVIGVKTAANRMMMCGVVTCTMEGALTVAAAGELLYLSRTTAGRITNDISGFGAGDAVVFIGTAKSTGASPQVYLQPARPVGL